MADEDLARDMTPEAMTAFLLLERTFCECGEAGLCSCGWEDR